MRNKQPNSDKDIPAQVVKVLISELRLFEGVDLLVSAAGTTDIADGIRKACPGAIITFVEQNKTLYQILESKGCFLMNTGDFLKVDCWPGFDRIALIPPFMYKQEIKHVRHAFLMLKPGGRLIAIVRALAHFCNQLPQTSLASPRMNGEASHFHDWVKEFGGKIEELPEELLQEGDDGTTTARLHIIIINKPEVSSDGATTAVNDAEVTQFSQVIPVTAAGA